jgi:predicted N-acetyltransferase YhbS
MAIGLRPATPDDIPELGRICYEAFRDISERHGFPTDFPNLEFAQNVVGLLVQNEDVHSIAAVDGTTAKGSNFTSLFDEVAGIGPISVDVTAQGEGIGRKLMLEAIDWSNQQDVGMVRLCQDAFNMQSLALYASVGFVVREPLSMLRLSATAPGGDGCRAATASDLDAMDELCRRAYHISRRGEAAMLLRLGFPAFVSEADGRMAGYLLGTPFGHGVAESDRILLELMAAMGAQVPESVALAPMRNGELYRRALEAGHRNQKVMNLMTYGPYEEPTGTYAPSVLF